MGCVYCITSPTGMKYVGKTTREIKRRISQHCSKGSHCSAIKKAIDEYGIENMCVEVLEECADEDLFDREKYWVDKLGTLHPNGYNMYSGGRNFKMSDEAIAKHAESKTGIKNHNYGKPRSDEFKRKLSAAMKGHKFNVGRKASESTKELISEKLGSKVMCVETGEVFRSAAYAAKSKGIYTQGVSRAARGDRNTAGGYHWKYV